MTHLSREFCLKARDARRERGLSQSALAHEVGCKQSALSMFEGGDGTKLNDEVIARIAEKFGLDLPSSTSDASGGGTLPVSSRIDGEARGFCPNPNCPSNRKYEVDGRVFIRPNREECDPVNGKYCAVCGEVLEKLCPNCGAQIHAGAVCSFCGRQYVVAAALDPYGANMV